MDEDKTSGWIKRQRRRRRRNRILGKSDRRRRGSEQPAREMDGENHE